MNSFLRPLGAVLALASSTSALAPQTPFGHSPPQDLAWDIPPHGSFGRSVSADVDGDGLRDLAFLDGDELRVVLAPGLFGAVLNGVATAADVGVWLGEGTDALISVGPSGARSHHWDASALLWQHAQLSTDSAWQGASALACRPMSDGSVQVFGLTDGGYALRVLRDGGDEFVLGAGTPMAHLALFDRDGDGTPELAVAGGEELHVLEVETETSPETWTLQESFYALGFDTDDLAAGARADGPDWVAWLVTPDAIRQYLTLVTSGGLVSGAYVHGDPQVVALASGDWNGDGARDLGLSWKADHRLGLLFDQAPSGAQSPVFDYVGAGGHATLDLGGDPDALALANGAEPAFDDLDCDGDDDVCVLVQDRGELFVGVGTAIDESAQKPRLGAAESNSVGAVTLETVDTIERLQIVVSHPEELPGQANGIQLVLWRMPPDPEVPGPVPAGPILPAALDEDVCVVNGSESEVVFQFDLPEGFQASPDGPLLESMYFWIARYVDWDGSQVTRVYPAQAYGMHAKGDAADPGDADAQACDQALVDYGGADRLEVTRLQGGTLLSDILGGLRPIPCLPNLPCDDPPRW